MDKRKIPCNLGWGQDGDNTKDLGELSADLSVDGGVGVSEVKRGEAWVEGVEEGRSHTMMSLGSVRP